MSDANSAQPDGLIDEKLSRLLGRSWKTTLLGLVAIVAGVVAAAPGVSPAVQHVAEQIALVAAGGGLIFAKDKGVSGGKR